MAVFNPTQLLQSLISSPEFQAHHFGRMRTQPEQSGEAGKVERDLPEAERHESQHS